MADRKTGNDGRDSSRVSGEQDYEVRHFAEQNNISVDQARALIATHGNDRATLTAEARKLASTGLA